MKAPAERALDAVEQEIANLRGAANMHTEIGIDAHYRLQQLYLHRDKLQARQFRALQAKIARMKK